MIEVTVKVPEERHAEFHSMFGEWLQASPTVPAEGEGQLLEWSASDIAQAKHVWSKMSPKAKKLFQLLLNAPGAINWEKLAEALGPNADAGTVAGTFGWPARYAREVGRVQPTRGKETEVTTVYWVEAAVKTVFSKVQK